MIMANVWERAKKTTSVGPFNSGHTLTKQVGARCLRHCPGIVWEPIRKRAHTQLVMEHSATVVSARWATGTDSGIKSGISVRELISISKKKKKKKGAEREWTIEHSPRSSLAWKKPPPLTALVTVTMSRSTRPIFTVLLPAAGKVCTRCRQKRTLVERDTNLGQPAYKSIHRTP